MLDLRRTSALTLMLLLRGGAAVAADWEPVADIPRFRQEHSAVTIDDRYIYLIGGVEPDLLTTVPIDRYDTLTGTWEPAYDALPADRTRNHFNAIVYEGEVYLAGGKVSGDGTGRDWFDKWNPVTKEWTVLPDLPESHWGGPAILDDDRLHVVSGAVKRLESTTHHFAIDLAAIDSGWSQLPDIPEASVHAAGFELNDKLYVVGGESEHSHPELTEERHVFEYDPLLGEWAEAPDFPIVRHHAEWGTFVHEGLVHSVSGADNELSPRGQDAIYVSEDPSKPDSWTQPLPSLPKPLIGPSALVVDNRLWVMGGWDSEWAPENRVRDAWVLDLAQPKDNDADFDGNGVVDAQDYDAWAAAFHGGQADAADFTLWRDRVVSPAGDFDRDGRLDPGDFAIWSASYGQAGDPPHGDANEDGVVDAADFNLWRDAVETPPGDFNRDGRFTAADYGVWAASFGQADSPPHGDANGDGVVDAADFNLWRDAVETPPGDFNRDGRFNAADYRVWAASFGQAGSPPHGDANGDGVVDAADYTMWRDGGAHVASPSAAVPEPACSVMLIALFYGAAACARPVAR